jgi:N-acetylneuraminic acid mutarotase
MHETSLKVLQFVMLFMLLGVMTAIGQAQSQGSWTMKAPIPMARNEVALAAIGGKVHVIGGSVKGVAGTYHDEYDPATDRWRTRAPLPHGLDHIGTAVLNGKIYTVGGFVASVHKDGQPHVFEYDPATDSWRSLSPLKSGLGSVAVTVLDGKIHASGGRTPAGETVATHQVYDFATNTWTERASLPKARDHMALVAAEGKRAFRSLRRQNGHARYL